MVKGFLLLLVTGLVAFGMYTLWQRQPKIQPEKTEQASQLEQKQIIQENLSPIDGSVIKESEVELKSKGTPKSSFLIYSNTFQNLVKSNDEGTFTSTITLDTNLNLIKIIELDQGLQQVSEKTLTYYYAPKSEAQTVSAGPVKSIFDSLITLTSTKGELNVRTSKSTEFEIPQIEGQEEATAQADNIRIGDYIIVLGNSEDSDSLIAQNVEVIRQNKPQITKKLLLGTIASSVRQNLFSAKDKDGEIVEFTLNKNSEIFTNNEVVKNDQVQKDKKVIILYASKDNETNTVDTIYLIP